VFEYEADPRQAEKILTELGFENCKGASTPAVRHSIDLINTDEAIENSQVTRFRAVAARGRYLAADRPEYQYSANGICRFMAEPTEMIVEAFNRLGRYPAKHLRLVCFLNFQDMVDGWDVHMDTDQAGCLRTRRSPSGGCVLAGSH